MKLHLGGVLAVSVLVGCVHLNEPRGYTNPNAPEGVMLLTQHEAMTSGLQPWSLTLPFGANEDGTELVLEFMKRAEAEGARYVSDVSLVLRTEEEGQTLECRTRFQPVKSTEAVQETVMEPSRTVSRSVMVPVTRMVSELQYRCHMVSVPRMVSESYQDMTYDAHSKSMRSVTRTRMVTRHEMRNECRHESVMRMATRFEFQHRTGFIPPSMKQVTNYRSSWRLIEAAPECSPAEADTPLPLGLPHRIEGHVHGCVVSAPPPMKDEAMAHSSRAERLREKDSQKKSVESGEKPACTDKVMRLEEPVTPEAETRRE